MARLARIVLSALLPLMGAGCLSFSLDGARDNRPHAMIRVHRLEPGRSTLREALERLGPPDLILRVGEVDRLYYASWDSLYFKMSFSIPVPLPGRSMSTDAFILGLGSEDLRLVRLEFDRQGILRLKESGEFSSSLDGQYFAIDDRIVSNFIEDRARVLAMVEEDEDDEDEEVQRKK
jgi:hypothetical protein